MRSACKVLSAAVLLGLAVLSCKPISISPVPHPRPSDKEEEEVKEIKVTGVTLDQSSAEVEVESEFDLVASVQPKDATNSKVTWSSSDSDVATVEDGKVRGVAVGEAVITVKTVDGDKTASCKVTVKEKPYVYVTGITLDRTEAEVEVGQYVEYFYLHPEITPEDATNKNVTWSSSNTNVATVSESGRVAVYRVGSATITATTEDGEFTASCTLTVKQKPVVKVTGVEMYYKTRTVKVGEKFDIAATVSPGDATNRGVSWTWTPEELIERYNGVFTYQSHGNVDVIFLAKAPGTVTITIKTSDGSFTDTCEVTITE